jgi:uncharacterized protein (TIGR01244 family)
MTDMQNRMQSVRAILALALVAVLGVALGARPSSPQGASSQQPAAQPRSDQAPAAPGAVAGVRNFTKVDSTIACGGALSADAFAALKQAGYKSIVNLRAASEQGANVEAEQKAAQDAGLTYIHLPFASTAPDASKLDEFLKAVAAPENQPMMLHCASGGRASMFWAVKRVMLDNWPVEKAMNELPDLTKNVGEALRTFTLDYLKSHGKNRP